MARRSTRTTQRHLGTTGAARRQPARPSIVHSSLYLPEPVYEALRKIAFEERLKIHDIVLEGIDLALLRRGYPSVESLKAGAFDFVSKPLDVGVLRKLASSAVKLGSVAETTGTLIIVDEDHFVVVLQDSHHGRHLVVCPREISLLVADRHDDAQQLALRIRVI